MSGSIRLGRLFGIQISVSALFLPLFALLLVVALSQGWPAVFVLGSVLGSVLLHELGHALTAQRFGIRVHEIKFWLLGGVAQMSHIPEHPRVEGLIAIAGPLVNLMLAALAVPFILLGSALSPLAGQLAQLFLIVNLALGIFNLLPAFPMDGGRILRAVLATRLDWLQATEVAVRVGRWVALALAVFGVFVWSHGLFLLPLIAIYVWWQGTMELAAVRLRHGMGLFGAMAQSAFGGAGQDPLAAFFGNGQPNAAQAETAHTESPRRAADTTTPPTGARRPVTLRVDRVPRGGLTDAEIEALERYPGRLRPGRGDPD